MKVKVRSNGFDLIYLELRDARARVVEISHYSV